MRELTAFQDKKNAERLVGYLITKLIPVQLEEEHGQWVVWVINDDDRDAARQILEIFQRNPEDSRYDAAIEQARELARQDEAVQKKIRRRQVDMTKRWSGHWWYAHPATNILIAISLLVAIVCTDWKHMEPGMLGLPALCTNQDFVLLRHLYVTDFEIYVNHDGNQMIRYAPPWPAVLRGEIWRPITPIFLHFGVLHILFNMMWMKQLASSVESVKGTRRFLVLVFLIALISNLAEFYWSGPKFGGMSGVVFGMIGYVWMQGKTQPREGLALPQEILVFAFLWLFLCMGGAFGHIANAAHLVGFGVGILLGARQALWKSAMHRLRS
ncbi:MAG: rhomboid family intramembrane serine protease [Fuerstiella sp.]|nr:rhomboid family intramembrane serine protease [Fuerstiella sp.]